MGFRTGSAATWPSWSPGLTGIGGTSAPVFRTSPGSGLVFLVGTLTVPATLGGNPQTLSDTPAPAAFRPRQLFYLTPDLWSYAIDTAGNLVWNPQGRPVGGGGTTLLRTYYFADTPTP